MVRFGETEVEGHVFEVKVWKQETWECGGSRPVRRELAMAVEVQWFGKTISLRILESL